MTGLPTSTPPPGWYPDPAGSRGERYYDGALWTESTRPVTLKTRSTATPPAEPSTPQDNTRRAFPTSPNGSPSTPGLASPRTPARGHKSLTDALARPNPQSSQAMLIGTSADPRVRRRIAWTPDSGWYPDPARSNSLRFYNGQAWTARTRPPIDEGIRRLPTAALRLRAAFLEAQDAAALRRGEKIRKHKLIVPNETSAPSLQLKSHSPNSIGTLIATLVIVVGLLASGLVAWQLWGSDYYNTFQQQNLSAQLTAEPNDDWVQPVVIPDPEGDPTDGEIVPTPTPTPDKTTPGKSVSSKPSSKPKPTASSQTRRVTQAVPPKNKDGRPVGRIRIPAIGLNRIFVLGTDAPQLAKGPGLWKWGAFPGTPGNTTLSGHRTTHGAPFRNLDDLDNGDKIIIEVPGQPDAVYEVRGHTIASPFDVNVTKQTAGVRITLTTCNPVGSARERLVIEGELISGAHASEALPDSNWKLLK